MERLASALSQIILCTSRRDCTSASWVTTFFTVSSKSFCREIPVPSPGPWIASHSAWVSNAKSPEFTRGSSPIKINARSCALRPSETKDDAAVANKRHAKATTSLLERMAFTTSVYWACRFWTALELDLKCVLSQLICV